MTLLSACGSSAGTQSHTATVVDSCDVAYKLSTTSQYVTTNCLKKIGPRPIYVKLLLGDRFAITQAVQSAGHAAVPVLRPGDGAVRLVRYQSPLAVYVAAHVGRAPLIAYRTTSCWTATELTCTAFVVVVGPR